MSDPISRRTLLAGTAAAATLAAMPAAATVQAGATSVPSLAGKSILVTGTIATLFPQVRKLRSLNDVKPAGE